MHIFKIFIQAKHKTYITNFIKLFNKKSKTHLKSIKRDFKKKKSKFFFSILTSPHVNKRAQEQFETRVHKLQLKVDTLEPLKLIIMIKRLYSQALPNLRIKIKLKVHKSAKKHFIEHIRTIKIPLKEKIIKLLDSAGI
jgi:ribosomal protein S10